MAHVPPSPFTHRRRFRSSATAPNARRTSRAGGSSLGVSAAFVAVCCSTLVLQAFTTPAPPPVVAPPVAVSANVLHETRAAELFDALLARVTSTVRAAATKALMGTSDSNDDSQSDDAVDMRAMDLRVSNVSVHRVRYVENSGPSGSCSAAGVHDTSAAAEQTDDMQCADDGVDNADAATSDANDSTSADATESFMGRWTRKVQLLHPHRRAEVTSVVVTWDDHFRGASAIATDDLDVASDSSSTARRNAHSSATTGPIVTYEVQHWVHGWGLDALWHPSNRKLSVADPFVVLSHLPKEHAVAFRVRMKVQKRAGLLSTGWFAAETEGPWSAVALLEPSRDDALAAIAAFLLSNKMFSLVLLLCIGSGSLVVCRLFVLHRFSDSTATAAGTNVRMRSTSTALATVETPPMSELSTGADSETASDSCESVPRPRERTSRRTTNNSSSNNSTHRVASGDLAQEITHLRQELADSEAEVRKLMLFRGYGIEQLAPRELAAVEFELRATLQRIQRLRQTTPSHRSTRSSSVSMSSEDETDGDDGDRTPRTNSCSGSGTSNCRTAAGRSVARRRLGAVLEGVSAAV